MLTTTQAAKFLSVSVRRVQAMVKAGRLPATRLGRDWGIQEADLVKIGPRKSGRPLKSALPMVVRKMKG